MHCVSVLLHSYFIAFLFCCVPTSMYDAVMLLAMLYGAEILFVAQ